MLSWDEVMCSILKLFVCTVVHVLESANASGFLFANGQIIRELCNLEGFPGLECGLV